jgi:hypothetical protein
MILFNFAGKANSLIHVVHLFNSADEKVTHLTGLFFPEKFFRLLLSQTLGEPFSFSKISYETFGVVFPQAVFGVLHRLLVRSPNGQRPIASSRARVAFITPPVSGWTGIGEREPRSCSMMTSIAIANKWLGIEDIDQTLNLFPNMSQWFFGIFFVEYPKSVIRLFQDDRFHRLALVLTESKFHYLLP